MFFMLGIVDLAAIGAPGALFGVQVHTTTPDAAAERPGLALKTTPWSASVLVRKSTHAVSGQGHGSSGRSAVARDGDRAAFEWRGCARGVGSISDISGLNCR